MHVSCFAIRQSSVTASQSSLWRTGFDAGNALDGKVPQAINSVIYCIHTQQTSNPWWQVSRIESRSDCTSTDTCTLSHPAYLCTCKHCFMFRTTGVQHRCSLAFAPSDFVTVAASVGAYCWTIPELRPRRNHNGVVNCVLPCPTRVRETHGRPVMNPSR